MKKVKAFKHLLPLFILIACGASSDEKNSFKDKLGYKYAESDNSVLWEISGKGLKQPSFIYGTIHIQDKRVFAYSKVVNDIFDTCSAYAMEINMDEVDLTKTAKMAMLDKPLYEIINPKKFLLLDSLMKKRTGSGVGMYNNMKPFFMAAVMLKAYEHQDMPFPLDLDFFKKAKKKKKKLIGIEKFEEQMAAVDKMTIEEQADMIIEGLKDWDKTKDLYTDMVKIYVKQDLPKLMELMKDTTLPKAFETSLLTDRNKIMAERIDSIVQQQSTFNAIGAAHLGGKDGVVELLRQRGYTVKPVKFKFKK